MNDLAVFDFEGGAVRSITDAGGVMWWVGKDVCQCLEIADHKQALERLDEDERGGYSVPSQKGVRNATCVNEPGLYSLILTSRKASARRFKRWVTHEVLPAIRRTGIYATPAAARALVEASLDPGPARVLAATRLTGGPPWDEAAIAGVAGLSIQRTRRILRLLGATGLIEPGADVGALIGTAS